MTKRSRLAPREPVDGSGLRWPGATAKFALLGEVLWVGILMAVVCLPLVTWPAAFAAGSSHLRRFLRGEGSTVGQFFGDVRLAAPGGVAVGAGSLVVGAVVALDLGIAADGGLPGARLIAVVLAVAAAAGTLFAVTAAVTWRPGSRWRAVLFAAPRLLVGDPFTALMTAVALGLAALITWQYVLLIVPALGMLAFAVVAIHERRSARSLAAA